MPFPSPPWQLRAHVWLSVFVLRRTRRADRPPGMYGVAFVDYLEGSALTYHELFVARLLRAGRVPSVRVTDMWVDSAESRAAGRAFWALPKELADLPLHQDRLGPVWRTTFSGVARGSHLASGRFTSAPGAAPVRVPFAAGTVQEREDGTTLVTPVRGTARGLPCHAAWTFDPDGPLAFLHDRRPVASFRLPDVRLRVG